MRDRGKNAPEVVRKPKIDNTELVTTFKEEGGGIVHLRPTRKGMKGVTIAFIRKGRRVTFTTAVQHSADTFCKKNGTKVAIERFREGKTVVLPLPGEYSVAEAFKYLSLYFW